MAPVKLVPLIVTKVLPASGPLVGARPVTVGGESTILGSIHSIRGRRARDRFKRSFRRNAKGHKTMMIASKAVTTRRRRVSTKESFRKIQAAVCSRASSPCGYCGERTRRNVLSHCANANANDQELAEAASTDVRNSRAKRSASSSRNSVRRGGQTVSSLLGITVIIAIIYVNHCRSE